MLGLLASLAVLVFFYLLIGFNFVLSYKEKIGVTIYKIYDRRRTYEN